MNTAEAIKPAPGRSDKQTRYLSQAIQLEESVNPQIISATLSMISLSILAFVAWAGFTNIYEVARTPGEVVPQGYQQTVQHLEGGIVKDIKVREGDIVERGQILIALSDGQIRQDLERARSRQSTLEMQAERLRAYIEGRQPNFGRFGAKDGARTADQEAFFADMRAAREKEAQVIRDQIAQKRQSIRTIESEIATQRSNLSIARDMLARRSALNAKGYASDMQVMDDRRSIIQTEGDIARLSSQRTAAQREIQEFEGRLASLTAGQRDQANERLDAVMAEIAENAEVIDKMEERIARLEVRSPARGLVKGVAVNTIGAVVQPGQTLMEIVPLDKSLEVQVKISPKDIGHVKPGQRVQVKFSAFDFSRYGSTEGRLEQISATTFADENGGRFYKGRILLNHNYVGRPENTVMPGMTVMADVITGEHTILQYLLKPIHVSMSTAFTER